jgi:hypothetical protein
MTTRVPAITHFANGLAEMREHHRASTATPFEREASTDAEYDHSRLPSHGRDDGARRIDGGS